MRRPLHRAAAILAAVLVAASAACSTPEAEEGGTTASPTAESTARSEDGSDGPTEAEDPSPTSSHEEGTEGELEYVDPAAAADACGVYEDLIGLNAQAASQTAEASVLQLEERLRLISGAAGALAGYADSDSERDRWEGVEQKYEDAADLLGASGGQVANDSFLGLLADAVEESTAAFEAQQDYAETTCGLSLGPLLGE